MKIQTLLSALFFALAAWSLGAAGCASLEDPGCSSDSDCRFGRVCSQGFCVGEADANVTNNSTSGNSGNSGNATTNSGNSGNATTNSGNSGNATTNSGNAGNNGACRPGGCPEGLFCNASLDCVDTCASDNECSGNRVCVGDDCVVGTRCEFGGTEGDGQFCAAFWECEDGFFEVFCDSMDDGRTVCECLDGTTGEITSGESDRPISCDSDAIVESANTICKFGIIAEGF